MRLTKKFDYALITITIASLGLLSVALLNSRTPDTFADDGTETVISTADHHLIIYDQNEKYSIKTDAKTVADALARANISLGDYDTTDPALETEIDADNFYINIYRAHPVIVKLGAVEKYLMTTSYDAKTIASSAGFTIYDGDEINLIANTNFLEAGAANTYEVIHNGGHTITIEEEIPFSERTVIDYSLSVGTSKVEQLGEVGRKTSVYEILSVDGAEVSRTLISETVNVEPVEKIIVVGGRLNSATSASENEQIAWNFLKGQGFTDYQAAGIMGNLTQEHHFETSDTVGGIGIAQWTGGRRTALLSRSDPYNIYTQLEYLMEELNGQYYTVQNALRAATTIEEATQIFQNQFERCGICREEKRIGYAYDIYERYAK